MEIAVEEWECEFCTFINHKSYHTCEICKEESKEMHIKLDENLISNFKKKIKNRKFEFEKIFIVIHPIDEKQMEENMQMIAKKMLNQIFIISNDCDSNFLISTAKGVRKEFPKIIMGINFVGENLFSLVKYIHAVHQYVDIVMIDNCQIYENETTQIIDFFVEKLEKVGYKGLLFGGIYFKHQKDNGDKQKVISLANEYFDVLCTSGEKTGSEIKKEKLIEIKRHTKSLMLCSGVNASNVHEYGTLCEYIMVGTGVLTNEILDSEKINLLYSLQ
jgi:hypothetical protein